MIFTDNSRQSAEHDCARKRYWNYHGVNGFGIDKKAINLPAATGIHIHGPLASIMELVALGKTKVLNLADKKTRGQIRLAIAQSLKAYREEVKRAESFRDNSQAKEDTEFFLTEQCTLIEGFAWTFCRMALPSLMKEFEPVTIEREEHVVLGCTCGAGKRSWEEHAVECEGIVQQSKPDLIMRRLNDGALGNHDFKTHKYVGESEIAKYKSSVQMAVGTVGAERSLGERVTHYYIHAMQKGDRRQLYVPETRTFDGRRQQLSPFCYIGFKPAAPPTQRNDFFDATDKSKWYQRPAVWDLKMFGKPPEMSNVEWLVEKLPVEVLQKQLFLIGPYDRQDHLIKDHLLGVEQNERLWQARQWAIYDDVQAGADFRNALAKHVPASWNCYKYGEKYPCQFFDICHLNGVSPADPLASGQYVLRVPHHDGEMLAMKAAGVELPEGVVAERREE